MSIARKVVWLVVWGALLALEAGLAQVPAELNRLQATHLLNRTAYGPRPGDVDSVMRTGALAYLDRQLDPGSIDDTTTESALRSYSILSYSQADLWQMMLDHLALKKQEEAAGGVQPESAGEATATSAMLRQRRTALSWEVQQVALVRAISSERQLHEVMVDFWFNHFNVFMASGRNGILLPGYVEQVIRPHALGRFRDLLGATARSPAMLTYLNNDQSVAPGSERLVTDVLHGLCANRDILMEPLPDYLFADQGGA